LPAPPDKAATRAEIAELEALAAQRDPVALDRIGYWDAGSPAYRWNELAIRHTQSKGIVGNRAIRMLALLNVAIADATVAAWDTKYAYKRARPAEFKRDLDVALPAPASPAYPSEHAVAAGAASTVLSHIFAADAATFAGWAEEAGRSRLLAGTDYPSDVAAGLELGRQVGAVVVEWAKADGSDAIWDGVIPTGPGKWTGTNPIEPTHGSWKTWVLASGSQFRPGPPPAYDSEQMASELAEVKNFRRTNLTNITASYWEYYGGRAIFEYWNGHTGRKIFEYRLDGNAPRAARLYALVHVGLYDAGVACWDAKYAYWAIRPFQLDPTLTTVFVTPNHPSFPSAHSCYSGAAGAILGQFFPRDAAYFNGLADEAGQARIMGGIHFPIDCSVGLELGRSVADTVMARARNDGAG
jgi:membrane-associated phospholipid phosphatase